MSELGDELNDPTNEALSHGLLLPFDVQDPEFARGFEMGRLWERLKWDDEEFAETVHATNAEMVLRISEATERAVRSSDLDEGFLEVVFAEKAHV